MNPLRRRRKIDKDLADRIVEALFDACEMADRIGEDDAVEQYAQLAEEFATATGRKTNTAVIQWGGEDD